MVFLVVWTVTYFCLYPRLPGYKKTKNVVDIENTHTVVYLQDCGTEFVDL